MSMDTGIHRVIVKMAPTLLQALITEGNKWIESEGIVSVKQGLPADAKFLRAWYEGGDGRNGTIVLLFEHPSFPEVIDGNRYPEFDPVLIIHNPEVS